MIFFYFTKNKKGAIFLTVMAISALLIMIAVSASNMLLQDVHMIRRLKHLTQAQLVAEAGVSQALATLAQQGFSAKDNAANFPSTSFGPGSFDVTVIQSGGRVLLSSEGIVEGVSKTVSVEIKDAYPTALNYIMSAGGDITLAALLSDVEIDGDMHANNRADIYNVIGDSELVVTGTATASNDKVYAYTWKLFFSTSISIDGTVYTPSDWGLNTHEIDGGAVPVTFPSFNLAYYKALAQASGDYYAEDTVFGSHYSTTDLEPANGIIYVDGDAEFRGTCNLHGGVVADSIKITNKWKFFQGWSRGRLAQYDSGQNRNVILSKGTDPTDGIRVWGYLDVLEENSPGGALIYAKNDFITQDVIARVDVRGCIIAENDLDVGTAIAYIDYTYSKVIPDGLVTGPGGVPFEIVSWNK